MGRAVVDTWAPHTSVRNLYGPTETTIGVTIGNALMPGDRVRLGSPVSGVRLMVLDERLHPVPAGVPGELYVSGPALSRGYLDRPGLTGSRFVAGVFGHEGDRMYRTGDVVRWWPDDEGGAHIEYEGREDDQIKVRGLRIEPGEIEAALVENASVDAAAVIAVGAGMTSSLAAYVVVDPDHCVEVGELRIWLASRLPAHLVPETITVLDALPLTPVGKLDRRRLPEPVVEAAEYRSPATELEARVTKAFGDVLGLERVSVTSSFFEIGGNSLAATQVLAHLRPHHPDMQVSWVFREPTVRGLAGLLAADSTAHSARRDVLLTLRSEGRRAPLFCVHPAGGLAWFYGGLVRYLPDRPVYGLQDPYVVSGDEQAGSVEELAQRYLSEIRRVRPHGPYHLLGWSLGGYVIHEMAVRLEAAGEEVGFVGVMDASPGAADLEAGRIHPGGQVAADALAGWRDLFDLGPDVVASGPEEVAEVVREQIAATGLLGADEVARVMNSFEHAAQIVADHDPRTGLSVPMVVFTATRDKSEPGRIARGWEAVVDGGVRNVDVDATHLGMAEERALEVIGPEIGAALAAHEHNRGSRGKDQR
ncbi:Dimodular nonribosomal peptide synthase [Gordonia bronchialis]|uniref:thioesterase domain-containing protein n=1 Tax=Gordonia bronchialis TaxID=2054 RepID=UPI000A058DA2|nr:thioesterase domain-containing protein [Gordonia bronchialis]STQ65871.1 Dimodular nonribosomal peptide synthase [Gordonia bronchialis]